MILRVVLRDGRDVGVALVRHKHHPILEAVHLVGLALGDDHERARDERLARALTARDVEDRARLDILPRARRLGLKKFGNAGTGFHVAFAVVGSIHHRTRGHVSV